MHSVLNPREFRKKKTHAPPFGGFQRLVRSVLCTRIAMPAADNVSNRVLRAVLGGDTEELVEAVKRKHLKDVMVALTADNR